MKVRLDWKSLCVNVAAAYVCTASLVWLGMKVFEVGSSVMSAASTIGPVELAGYVARASGGF
jgi:hypothetical protein